MKLDDEALKSYLVKNLQPITAADPALLANYVAALVKNNKPKSEVVDKLYDFLGDGTKQFVTQLFKDIEDVAAVTETVDESAAPPPATTATTAAVSATGDATTDAKSSPPHVTRTIPSAIQANDDGDESSDDEDDDRNHKHRRRVSRSRSFEKDAEDAERSHYRKRSRSTENGHYRENYRHYEHRRSYRGRETLGSRIVADGNVHGGMRGSLPFRDSGGGGGGSRFFGSNLQRSIGGGGRGAWIPPEQRFPGGFPPDFNPALLAQGPAPPTNIFPGRVSGGRGGPAAQPWGNFALLENGSVDVIGRGGSVNPISLINRTRCLDFEERGYCLRGDLCPMEHGANRIVVEDVQSLSKLTLPMGNSRNGTSSAPTEKGARSDRESLGTGEDGNPGTAVSDSYDPDQPIWGGKDPSDKSRQWDNGSELGADGKTAENSKGVDAGVSVWDRIGPPADGDRKRLRLSGPDEGNGHIGSNGAEKRSSAGTSYGARDDRSEKAQRTLYVRCIPPECNKTEILKGHFQKFGKVLDIRIPSTWKDRAFVQFFERESAEAALSSPEAVLGNRFILLDWANRDNKPYPGKPGAAREVALNGAAAAAAATPVSAPDAKIAAANGAALKKQEELEQMKEEIRKKREALDSKRDEFKRKLDKLAKQGAKVSTETEPEDSNTTAAPPSTSVSAKSPVPRPGQQSNSTTTTTLPWGPSRYKIDNRTTVFRIVTPPPSADSDIPALKAHFGTFGEVSDLDLVDEGGAVQVSFATRRDAEKAFVMARSWQGQTLQFAWVNPAPAAAVAAPPPPPAAETVLPSDSPVEVPAMPQQDATAGTTEDAVSAPA